MPGATRRTASLPLKLRQSAVGKLQVGRWQEGFPRIYYLCGVREALPWSGVLLAASYDGAIEEVVKQPVRYRR
jgi:hypothetical protein